VLKQTPDRVTAALASLEGSSEFEVVLGWLEESLADLKTASHHTKDEVILRWQQGACQTLDDLIRKTRTSRQTQHSRRK
jgi:hypothetical protein